MIIGASGESDYQILNLSAGLYKKYQLKRVVFSAYIPVVEGKTSPLWIPSRRFCGNTGCIRRTGCCASTALMPASC